MIVLVFVLTIYAFLLAGAILFVITAASPQRQFALSSALWCAVWGPCVVAFEMLAGLSLAAEGLVRHGWGSAHLALPSLPVWKLYAAVTFVATAALASLAAFLHQLLISRMTFALFRLYATFVLAGIGSVLGEALWLWRATSIGPRQAIPLALCEAALLIVGFGYCGYRFAGQLRGARPERLSWLSQAEFEAPAKPS